MKWGKLGAYRGLQAMMNVHHRFLGQNTVWHQYRHLYNFSTILKMYGTLLEKE